MYRYCSLRDPCCQVIRAVDPAVYRARCFASAEEAAKYNTAPLGGTKLMSLDSILGIFARDMTEKGLTGSATEALAMDRLQFALLLLKVCT